MIHEDTFELGWQGLLTRRGGIKVLFNSFQIRKVVLVWQNSTVKECRWQNYAVGECNFITIGVEECDFTVFGTVLQSEDHVVQVTRKVTGDALGRTRMELLQFARL